MTKDEIIEYANDKILPRIERTAKELNCQMATWMRAKDFTVVFTEHYQYFENKYKSLMIRKEPVTVSQNGPRLDIHKMASCLCGATMLANPLRADPKTSDISSTERIKQYYRLPNEVLAYFCSIDYIGQIGILPEIDLTLQLGMSKAEYIFDGQFVPDSSHDSYLTYFTNILHKIFPKGEPHMYNYEQFALIFYHLEQCYRRKLDSL